MNFENLKTMSREQLLEVAGKQGLQVHWKAKPETIIKQIMEKAFEPQKPVSVQQDDPYADPRLKAERPVVYLTQDEVEAAIAPIKARRPDFVATYNLDEHTVKFSCRGAEETINMSAKPLTIRRHAEYIARGAARPMGHDRNNFDTINAQGKNAYTNTVLA